MGFLVGFATGALQEVNRRYDAHRDEASEREKNIRESLEKASGKIAEAKSKAAKYNQRYNLAVSYGAPEHMAHAYGVSEMPDDLLNTNIRQYKLSEQTRKASEQSATKAAEYRTQEQAMPAVAPQPGTVPQTPTDPRKERSFVDALLGQWPEGSAQYSAYENIARERGVAPEEVMREYSDILAGSFGPQIPEAPQTPPGAPPLVNVTEQQAQEETAKWLKDREDGFKTGPLREEASRLFYEAYLTGDGEKRAKAEGMYDPAYAREVAEKKSGRDDAGWLTQGQIRAQTLLRLKTFYEGEIDTTKTDAYGNIMPEIREGSKVGKQIGALADQIEQRIMEMMGGNMQKVPISVLIQAYNEVAEKAGLKARQPTDPGAGGDAAAVPEPGAGGDAAAVPEPGDGGEQTQTLEFSADAEPDIASISSLPQQEFAQLEEQINTFIDEFQDDTTADGQKAKERLSVWRRAVREAKKKRKKQ